MINFLLSRKASRVLKYFRTTTPPIGDGYFSVLPEHTLCGLQYDDFRGIIAQLEKIGAIRYQGDGISTIELLDVGRRWNEYAIKRLLSFSLSNVVVPVCVTLITIAATNFLF